MGNGYAVFHAQTLSRHHDSLRARYQPPGISGLACSCMPYSSTAPASTSTITSMTSSLAQPVLHLTV
eukprot:668490-Rhodomonas_salina.5